MTSPSIRIQEHVQTSTDDTRKLVSDSNQAPLPDDIQAALQQMEALQQKLQLFSQDFRTEEEGELRWQLEEVNFEIREMMNLSQAERNAAGQSSSVDMPQRRGPPHPEAIGGQQGGYSHDPNQRPPSSISSMVGGVCC